MKAKILVDFMSAIVHLKRFGKARIRKDLSQQKKHMNKQFSGLICCK